MPKVHNPIGTRKNFVCEPSSDYRKKCGDPGWQGKAKMGGLAIEEFAYILEKTEKSKSGKKKRVPYLVPWEAHHILSVSCVNNLDKLNSKHKAAVKRCCDVTNWDINNSDNLIALPLFGHTLKWYEIDENEDEPGWKDLPQHDWDHNSTKGYCTDVRNDILDFYRSLEQELKEHNLEAKPIEEELIDMQDHWRDQIHQRGTKAHSAGKGTHSAWDNQKTDWYKPFSMAKNKSEDRRPPLRISRKRDRLRNMLNKWRPT